MAVTQKIASKLNRIYHPGTKKSLLFRYYDPRVLNAFQPTRSIERANVFLGHVRTWLAIQTMARAWTVFSGAGYKLSPIQLYDLIPFADL